MNSTLNPAAGGPDAVLAARADERLVHAYEQIARADEQLARMTEHLSKMEHDAVRHPGAVGGARRSRDRSALRGLVGVVLAACIGAAAFVAQSSYGEAARLTIAQWAPNLMQTSPSRPGRSAPGPSPIQLASAEAAQAQPASPSQAVATPPAPVSPELTQMLQAMAHDIAVMEQGIEQLKEHQDRIAADIEQLKASQEQIHLAVARPSEPPARARTPTPAPRPVASAARKPPPAQAPQAQARAHAQPVQLQPDQR